MIEELNSIDDNVLKGLQTKQDNVRSWWNSYFTGTVKKLNAQEKEDFKDWLRTMDGQAYKDMPDYIEHNTKPIYITDDLVNEKSNL